MEYTKVSIDDLDRLLRGEEEATVENKLTTDEQIIAYIEQHVGYKFSDEQRQILSHHGGMRILACAGSGKTTSLVNLLLKRVLSGEITNQYTVVCTTYSNGGAEEMQARLKQLFSIFNLSCVIKVKTLHALYRSVLKAFGFSVELVDGSARYRYLREACSEAGFVLEDDTVLEELDGLLSYQINNLMTDKALYNSHVFKLEMTEGMYATIRNAYARKKRENNVIDFDDMQFNIFNELVVNGNKDMLAYCNRNFTDFYIDEAQDMSRIQFAILKKMIIADDKVVIIGDDDQCIYQWRGASPDIIMNICGIYDIRSFKLSTNYRCKANIVNPAARGIVYNSSRSEKSMQAFKEGGKLSICDTRSDNLYVHSSMAFNYIKKLVESGVQFKDIAVLSRNNAHMAILNSMLFMNGVRCSTVSNTQKFTKLMYYGWVKELIEFSKNTKTNKHTRNCLVRLIPYMSGDNARKLAEIQSNHGWTAYELLEEMALATNEYSYQSSSLAKLHAKEMANMTYIMRKLSKSAEEIEEIRSIMALDSNCERAIKLLDRLSVSTKFMTKTEDKARIRDGYVKYIQVMLKAKGVRKTLAALNENSNYDSIRENYENTIKLSTIHGAKGKEWKYVIILCDDNIAFPSFENIIRLKKSGVDSKDMFSDIDEGRRLHYVAMTRASDELMVFANLDNCGYYLVETLDIFKEIEAESTGNKRIIDIAMSMRPDRQAFKKIQDKVLDPKNEWYADVASNEQVFSIEDYDDTAIQEERPVFNIYDY